MRNLLKLSKEDLTPLLQTLSEELEELEEERSYVLKQTGIHLPGCTVTRYESESSKLQESIAALKTELEHRNT